MANEAVLMTDYSLPVNYTVADGNAITKGALLELQDLNTAIAVTGADVAIAGIAAVDKIASDGVTQLAVYKGGDFKMYLSGSVTVGEPLSASASPANSVHRAIAGLSGSKVLGYALETGATGETIKVRLMVGTGL